MTEPAATLLVRNVGRLVTCDPERGAAPGVVEGGAVAARDWEICAVGTEGEVAAHPLAADAVVVDAAGNAVVPGFVDAHSHLVWLGERSDEYAARAAGRSYEEIADAGGGIRATVAATRAGELDELVAAARPRARRMLRSGTTTVEVKSGYGLEDQAELRQLAAALALGQDPELPEVLTTYLPLHALPEGDRAGFVERACTRGVERAAPLARFVDAFCEQGAYTVEECARLLEAGARVAVATDCNPGTCYSESMPLMVALAVALGGLTPAEAVVAATAGGAAALGLTDRGVLRPGRRCDLAILDTPHWLDLGYHLGANPVRTVIRAGRVAAAG